MSDTWPTPEAMVSKTVRQNDTDKDIEIKSINMPQPYDAYYKEEKKRVRQQLKLQCLSLAISANKELTADQIVDNAKTFYDFVRP